MDMTVDNPIQYEVELVDELWSLGWAPFRTAGQSPSCPLEADVVAIRDNKIAVLNVVVLPSGTSTEFVSDESEALDKTKTRARASIYGSTDKVVVGHAVYKTQEEEWYYAPIPATKVSATDNYNELWRVISR